jgi:hypothetical protein
VVFDPCPVTSGGDFSSLTTNGFYHRRKLYDYSLLNGIFEEKIITIYDMQQFLADRLVNVHALLNTLITFSNTERGKNEAIHFALLFPTLEQLIAECDEENMNLPMTQKCAQEANRALSILKDQWLGSEEVYPHLSAIQGQMRRELESKLYYSLGQEEAKRYNDDAPFGQDVSDKCPELEYDLLEASKCLGLGRNTAAVFHLMRVMEAGFTYMKTIEGNPSFPEIKDRNWGTIIGAIEAFFITKHASKHRQNREGWKKEEPFFDELLALLGAVRKAWRNDTIHHREFRLDRSYDDERAENIFRTVKDFTRTIVTKLP